ncbi:MAG TPA: MauE/DoxX family redox-associated membrane protein [Chitinophagaceae bacterium]|nr:MauE/DoxX family redox-associated membrane protein [Chitinophagaceae bacterium]
MAKSRFRPGSEMIALLFIFLFTYTSVSKLLRLDNFIATLRRSPLLDHWAGAIAWFIVLAEWIIVLLLVYAPLRLWGITASLIIMLLFTFYIGYMIVAASSLPCSCGGILQELSWKDHFLLNIFLSILAALGIRGENKKLNAKHSTLV